MWLWVMNLDGSVGFEPICMWVAADGCCCGCGYLCDYGDGEFVVDVDGGEDRL